MTACSDRMNASSSDSSESGRSESAIGFRPPSQKQTTISATNASALIALVTFCASPPARTPNHCTSVKTATTISATVRVDPRIGRTAVEYSPTTIETAAVVPQVESQSLQPTMNPE